MRSSSIIQPGISARALGREVRCFKYTMVNGKRLLVSAVSLQMKLASTANSTYMCAHNTLCTRLFDYLEALDEPRLCFTQRIYVISHRILLVIITLRLCLGVGVLCAGIGVGFSRDLSP